VAQAVAALVDAPAACCSVTVNHPALAGAYSHAAALYPGSHRQGLCRARNGASKPCSLCACFLSAPFAAWQALPPCTTASSHGLGGASKSMSTMVMVALVAWWTRACPDTWLRVQLRLPLPLQLRLRLRLYAP
jgi:hypothetical protein